MVNSVYYTLLQTRTTITCYKILDDDRKKRGRYIVINDGVHTKVDEVNPNTAMLLGVIHPGIANIVFHRGLTYSKLLKDLEKKIKKELEYKKLDNHMKVVVRLAITYDDIINIKEVAAAIHTNRVLTYKLFYGYYNEITQKSIVNDIIFTDNDLRQGKEFLKEIKLNKPNVEIIL